MTPSTFFLTLKTTRMKLELLVGKLAAAKIEKSGINVLTASEKELEYIAGRKAAQTLSAAKAILYPAQDVTKIRTSQDIADVILPYLRNLDHEEFYVVALTRANDVIDVIQISSGGKSCTVVDTSILFKRLLLCGAAAFIISHNHPSGNLSPSREDDALTKKVKEGGLLLDIKLLDHIIVGKNDNYMSYLEVGKL